MSRVCPCGVSLFALALVTFATGCSSSPPISGSLSPSYAQAIDQSQSVTITATLTNDTSGRGASWSLTGPGSLSGSGPSVTYTSPTISLTAAQQATVTAAPIANPTKSASLQITVNPYPQMSIAQTLPNGTGGTPYSATITLTGGTSPSTTGRSSRDGKSVERCLTA